MLKEAKVKVLDHERLESASVKNDRITSDHDENYRTGAVAGNQRQILHRCHL